MHMFTGWSKNWLNDVRKPKTVNKAAKLLTINTIPNEQLSARCTVVSFTLNSDHNVLGTVFTREQPIRVKRPMADVPIFRRKNSDVRFWCLVVYHLMLSKHQSHHVADDSGHQQTRRFFSDFGTFKPYNFRIAQYITNLKQRPETAYIIEYLYKIWWTLAQWLLGTMHFCNFLEVVNLPKSWHFAYYLWPPCWNFTRFSWMLAICITWNSTKCNELLSTFLTLGIL